jgi:hypothetical protein
MTKKGNPFFSCEKVSLPSENNKKAISLTSWLKVPFPNQYPGSAYGWSMKLQYTDIYTG